MGVRMKNKSIRHKTANGFTLLELAVVMLILGTVMGGGVFAYAHYSYRLKAQSTDQKFDTVMNALSAYAQRYARLPCPADAAAAGANVGAERLGGDCFVHATAEAAGNTLYANTQGIVPWRELGIPESAVKDGWGHYFTYKPAPQLTVDNYSDEMMDIANVMPAENDVNNACRGPLWFDEDNNHIDRGKALFCCNAAPKPAYLTGKGQPAALSTNWRDQAIMAAGVATVGGAAYTNASRPPTNVAVESTNAWMDAHDNNDRNGSFEEPRTGTDNPDAPLIRATGHAVTLISHGGNGFLSFLRGQAANVRQQGAVNAASGVTQAAFMSADEALNVWPPQVAAATTAHPKAAGAAHDNFGKVDGASDDRVAWMRSDQIYSRLGSASCLRPASAGVVPNEPKCNDTLYGDVTYLVDTSGSMSEEAFNSKKSRLTVAKDALSAVIPQQIDDELTKDVDDPDMVGLNYFDKNENVIKKSCGVKYSGTQSSGIFHNFYDPSTKGFYTDVAKTQAALTNAKTNMVANINAMKADANTPLSHALAHTVAAMKSLDAENGTEDEPNALIFVSDGLDNCGGDMLATARRIAIENPYLDVHTIDVHNNPSLANMYAPFKYDAANKRILEIDGNKLIIRNLDGKKIGEDTAANLSKYSYKEVALRGKYVRPTNEKDFVKTLLDIAKCGGGGAT